MKLPFLSRKGGTQTAERKETKSGCAHPDQYRVQMHEDLKHPDLVTSVKCTQCGKTL